MLKVSTLLCHADQPPSDTLTLPFELRQKSRLVAALESGREIALVLPRGHVLRGGALLQAEDGRVIAVRAADEELSVVRTGDAAALVRAAYHLGNRHVALQIEDGALSYLHDHVLDDMLRGLGLEPRVERRAFEPEAGAYGRAGQHHEHGQEHDHHH
jgi:urease accessory protein